MGVGFGTADGSAGGVGSVVGSSPAHIAFAGWVGVGTSLTYSRGRLDRGDVRRRLGTVPVAGQRRDPVSVARVDGAAAVRIARPRGQAAARQSWDVSGTGAEVGIFVAGGRGPRPAVWDVALPGGEFGTPSAHAAESAFVTCLGPAARGGGFCGRNLAARGGGEVEEAAAVDASSQ